MAWLSDDRNEADAKLVKTIVRTASDWRWFDMAELLAATAARRIDVAPATRRLHAQMLMERGLSEEALYPATACERSQLRRTDPASVARGCENNTVLIDRSPEVVSDAVDLEEDFVQVPFVARSHAVFADSRHTFCRTSVSVS
jgi:hypothetical protein